ncbi:MOSC N-terminal beta barrel domain-containing protein [Luteimonas sp. RD2P54]|uniref:MOSC N-terminal beta barrel domain-containing protein n=1 Tax=Luteimonas endophytica TaxID=3042023 RepID=A0ABT6J7Q5_9GAMM|nr:MOSC N-terminal beta barrel domain-containing protein [Luteimonas endophytica]MDH5822857.1 MOSC N-terminal beta barrel domain-containing protein [Luteimonas endophytica]
MHLSGIHLYPVKSCAAFDAGSAEVEPRGLRHDRRWMAVDGDGRFLTGRKLPRLTLLRARPDADGIVLHAPGMPALPLPSAAMGERVRVTVWKDAVTARAAGAAADQWLSAFLEQPARLVHMDAGAARPLRHDRARAGDEVSFADSMPLLLVTRAALDGLNARLSRPVSLLRFRPNLVVDDAPAHAEDGWSRIRVGAIEFDVAKPCIRCVFTTVDPERGERDPDGEPLRTLLDYRRGDGGVSFGQLLIPRGTGTLRTKDPVVVVA